MAAASGDQQKQAAPQQPPPKQNEKLIKLLMDNLKTNLNDPDAFDLAKWEKELHARNLPGMKRVMPKGQKQSSMKDELVTRALSLLEKSASEPQFRKNDKVRVQTDSEKIRGVIVLVYPPGKGHNHSKNYKYKVRTERSAPDGSPWTMIYDEEELYRDKG